MGADFILHRSCTPKLTLGAGDDRVGTVEMVRLVKAGHMARLFEEQARETGKDVRSLSVVRHERNATTGDLVERPLTYEDLLSQEARLTALESHCSGCPVNLLGRTFGCYGAMRYPVRARSEEWLLGRLQPADSPGGFLCLSAVRDLGYTGEPIQLWRDNPHVKIFESPTPISRPLDPARPAETTVNSNQIWHAVFTLGSELQPFHCLYLPLWVGAVLLDGQVPASPDHLRQITRLTSPEERQERTGFDAGATDQGPDVLAVQRLLYACYQAWLNDVPLLMDA